MSQEEIEIAQEKVKQELPYIKALENVDDLKQKYQLNNEQATLTYKFRESIKKVSQKLKYKVNLKDNLMLESADAFIQQENELLRGEVPVKEETKRDKFLSEISNNGQYRKQVENIMQNKKEKEVLQTNDMER